jgi:hypothetical protein
LLGRENGQMYDYIQICGLWPIVWLDGWGPGRNMTGILVTRKDGEETCVLSQWAYSVKIFVVLCECCPE